MLNLGIRFDETFNFKQHVLKTRRCCFYHIRDLRLIRRYILLSIAKTIATTLVNNILDYCNSLLYNIVNKDIEKFQHILNCLARVVTRTPLFSRSMPLLKSLHWLPVHYRIIFKSCTKAYQALSSRQPACLDSMFAATRNNSDSYEQSVGTLFTLIGPKRKLEPVFSLLLHHLCRICLLSALNQNDMQFHFAGV